MGGHARQRQRLQADAQRLAQLLTEQGLSPTGGCALFQFCCVNDAAALHEFLALRGILTRLFDAPLSVRFGLPGDETGWQRLQQALAAFAQTRS
jgi:cobalamin biosynthetic protein CobC